MSLHRIRPDAGHCDPKLLPKGPRGFNLCRYCSTVCGSARRTFCSPCHRIETAKLAARRAEARRAAKALA